MIKIKFFRNAFCETLILKCNNGTVYAQKIDFDWLLHLSCMGVIDWLADVVANG